MQNIGTTKVFAKKVFWYWRREWVKKVSVLDQKSLSYKIRVIGSGKKYGGWKSSNPFPHLRIFRGMPYFTCTIFSKPNTFGGKTNFMKLGLEKANLATVHSADFFPPFILCYNPNSTLVTQDQKAQLRMRLLFVAVVVITSFFLINNFTSSYMLVSHIGHWARQRSYFSLRTHGPQVLPGIFSGLLLVLNILMGNHLAAYLSPQFCPCSTF